MNGENRIISYGNHKSKEPLLMDFITLLLRNKRVTLRPTRSKEYTTTQNDNLEKHKWKETAIPHLPRISNQQYTSSTYKINGNTIR